MRAREISRLTLTAGGAWLVLGAAVALERAGAPVPHGAIAAAGVAALALALSAAAQTAWRAWRGPVIRSFASEDAARCGPAAAEVVRAAAQLRGTLGGAGHLRRAGLVVAALAWLAVAGSAAAALVDVANTAGPLSAMAALGLSAAATKYRARPFYYREVTGGGVIVHPPDAWARLLRADGGSHRRDIGHVPNSRDEFVRNGWGNSLTPSPGGGKHTSARVD